MSTGASPAAAGAAASATAENAAASRFDGDWLALREPVDHRSRSHELATALGEFLANRPTCTPSATRQAPLVVDLGTGSGSNVRYLSRFLPHPLHWRLLDHDAGLLSALGGADPRDDVDRQVCDLVALSPATVQGADAVTASALLDLASDEWITRLAAACVVADAAVLVALTIDGTIRFSQPDPLDDAISAWVSRDHGRDKGLGVALGGAAPHVLVRALQAQGYDVRVCPANWQLDRRDAPLARALIAGWQSAARRQSPQDDDAISAWGARRVAALEGGSLHLAIGHLDVLGLPMGASARS